MFGLISSFNYLFITGELKPFNYTNLFGLNTTFGPVFHKKFLKAVLDLQKGIENINAPYIPWNPEAGYVFRLLPSA